MFDSQGSQFAQLMRQAIAGDGAAASDLILQLTNCQADIKHGGNMQFTGPVSFAEMPTFPDTSNGSGFGRLAVLDSDLVVSSSDQQPADAIIYDGDGGAEQTTGELISVWPWGMSSGTTISAGTEVSVERINGLWYVVSPNGSGGGGGPSFPTDSPGVYNTTVYNTSGTVIASYSVLQVTGIQDTGTNVYLKVQQPNTTLQTFYAVAGGDGLSASSSGYCTTYGLCRVLYNSSSGTPAYGEEWGAKSGQYSLEKGYPGFFILGVVDGTNHHAIAMQRGVTTVQASLQTALTATGSASATILDSSGAETTQAVTVYAAGMISTGYKLVSGTKVFAVFHAGRWVLNAHNSCEVLV